jgi:hypothetical protein
MSAHLKHWSRLGGPLLAVLQKSKNAVRLIFR